MIPSFEQFASLSEGHTMFAEMETGEWSVNAKSGDALLGYVRWYQEWKRYVFHPKEDTLFDKECLMDIAQFIHTETKKRQ